MFGEDVILHGEVGQIGGLDRDGLREEGFETVNANALSACVADPVRIRFNGEHQFVDALSDSPRASPGRDKFPGFTLFDNGGEEVNFGTDGEGAFMLVVVGALADNAVPEMHASEFLGYVDAITEVPDVLVVCLICGRRIRRAEEEVQGLSGVAAEEQLEGANSRGAGAIGTKGE